MARRKSPKGRQPGLGKRLPTKLSSAPHQPKSGRARQHVLFSYDPQRPNGKQVAWKARSNVDLPADLFPEAQGPGIGKIFIWFLVPIVVFVAFYLTTNIMARHVESGTIRAGSAVHRTLCTSLDIAAAAGLNFNEQTQMASCNASSEVMADALAEME